MINFLVLIGWHPMGDRELLSFEEMISEFSLERVQKGGAAFDKNKLDFFNAHYLKQLPVSQLVSLLSDEKFSNPGWRENAGLFEKVVSVVRDRLVTLADFKKLAELFFVTPTYDTALLTWKKSTPQAAKQNLEKCRELLREVHDAAFTKSAIEALIMPVAEQLGKGDVLWPLRVALSGKDASPPPIELAEALGKVESLSRIETAISKLASLPASPPLFAATLPPCLRTPISMPLLPLRTFGELPSFFIISVRLITTLQIHGLHLLQHFRYSYSLSQ
jgi:glutamyl/glutaminyl-tRNA synthetase